MASQLAVWASAIFKSHNLSYLPTHLAPQPAEIGRGRFCSPPGWQRPSEISHPSWCRTGGQWPFETSVCPWWSRRWGNRLRHTPATPEVPVEERPRWGGRFINRYKPARTEVNTSSEVYVHVLTVYVLCRKLRNMIQATCYSRARYTYIINDLSYMYKKCLCVIDPWHCCLKTIP